MRSWRSSWALVVALAGCSARSQPQPPVQSQAQSTTTSEAHRPSAMHDAAATPLPVTAPSIQSSAGAGRIDALFTQFAQKLPEPATLSEQNGATGECTRGGATYSLLYATSQKIPVATDAELRQVLPWARHTDPCIRQIAIDVLVTKLAYDRNDLSIPDMHDPAHYQFHAIHAALKARFDRKRIAYSPNDFGELVFVVEPTRAVEYLVGAWTEDVDATAGAQTQLAITPQASTLTSHHLPADARFADMVHTVTFKGLVIVDGHFVAKGDPAQQFWPVRQNIMWYRALSPYWIKLRRVSPR